MKHKRNLEKRYNKTESAYSVRIPFTVFTCRFNIDTGLFESDEEHECYRTLRWGESAVLDYNNFCFHSMSGYMRRVRTKQEITQYCYSKFDNEECGLVIKNRPRRGNSYLSAWELEKIPSMAYKRSWKMAYKCRKQWEVNL